MTYSIHVESPVGPWPGGRTAAPWDEVSYDDPNDALEVARYGYASRDRQQTFLIVNDDDGRLWDKFVGARPPRPDTDDGRPVHFTRAETQRMIAWLTVAAPAGVRGMLQDRLDDTDRMLDAWDAGQDRESYTDDQDRESYDTGTVLVWESAGTDEPRDQNASSDLAPHSWWSLGPNGNETWSVELIVCDDTLTEIPTEGVHLGRFDTEQTAKAAAETYERANRTEDAR